MKYKIKNIKTATLCESYVPNNVTITSKKPLSVNVIKSKLSQRYNVEISDFVCESIGRYTRNFIEYDEYGEPVSVVFISYSNPNLDKHTIIQHYSEKMGWPSSRLIELHSGNEPHFRRGQKIVMVEDPKTGEWIELPYTQLEI